MSYNRNSDEALSKELNVYENKIKPFFIVKTDEITDEQVAAVFDKAVVAGAELYDSVAGFRKGCGIVCNARDWQFFGVDSYGMTCIDNVVDNKCVEITIDQVDEHLGLK